MEHVRHETSAFPAATPSSIAAEPWLRDCWMIEVMPPTWAWAYRRMLNWEEAERRPRRLA